MKFLKLFAPALIFFLIISLFGLKVSKAQTAPPVCGNAQADVVLLIDRSGSMNDSAGGSVTKINAAKTAANNFIDILATDANNRAGVVSYATTSTINQSLTNNFQLAKNAVTSLSASGNTCIECGVYSTNQNILGSKRNNIKNAVILLSDGKANVIRGSTSRVGTNLAEEEALEEVELGHSESGTVFFTIGLGTDINENFLKTIASVTGGKYFASPTTNELNAIYQEISQVIAQGSISGVVFEDSNKDGVKDSSETNLPGWTINLSQTGSPTKSLNSDSSGGYTFGNLCDGSYTVSQIVKSGWEQTYPTNPLTYYSLSLTNGTTLANNNFGNSPLPTPTPPPQCVQNTPTLEVTPDTIVGEAGEEKVFIVKVTNNDSSACSASDINLDAISFNNPLWDISLEETVLTLNPGDAGTTNLRVTPPFDEIDGPKTITVIAQKDGSSQLTQNVKYVVDNPPAPSPTDTPTPTLTPTLTPSPSPTNPPTPTPTNTPAATFLSLTFGADGIGTTPRIPLGGNKNPLHSNRTYLVSVYDASNNNPVVSSEYTFSYSSSSEKFSGSFALPQNFQTGVYNVYVEGPQYLRTQFPGSTSIAAGKIKRLASANFNLIAGDINKVDQSENSIDLMDYNVLISCSIYAQSVSACDQNPNYKTWSDLNDDGLVDEDDYTLWLKELANQPGIPLPQ